jgi:hypothetical protein
MIDWNPDFDPAMKPKRERKTERIALILVAEIDDLAGHKSRMRVRNLSATGFGGVTEDAHHRLSAEQAVKVSFGNYVDIEATIVRVDGKNVGLRFDELVDLELIRTARVSPPSTFEPLGMHKVQTPQWMIERAKRAF